MEETELLALWKAYDRQLTESLVLNRRNAEDVTRLKVDSLLNTMRPPKLLGIVAGLVWVVSVDGLLIHLFPVANPFFLISALIQVVLTKLAIGIYLYQLFLLHRVSVSEPLLETQRKIARLKASTLWVARLLFLQLPVWTTFYWSEALLERGNAVLLGLQGLITLAATALAVWLFGNIRYANRHQRWFGLLFSGPEWEPMMKALELLDQLDEYGKEPQAPSEQ